MTGIQTATGAMTDRRPRPRRTSTGDVISRANLRRGVAAAGTAFRSTVPVGGSTGRVRERGRRLSASRDARQTDAEEPRVVLSCALCIHCRGCCCCRVRVPSNVVYISFDHPSQCYTFFFHYRPVAKVGGGV